MSDARQTPPIPAGTSAVVFNDMIYGNFRTANEESNAKIAASGIVEASERMVAAARKAGIPIVWIRVERRADRTDVCDVLTDVLIANNFQPKPATTTDSVAARQIDELPVLPEDHVILKPRIDPFIGTDLDLRLRSMGVDTILLGGVATNFGVEAIARTGSALNYNIVLLKDCCYNVDHESHEFSISKIMPTVARVMTSDEALSLLQ